MNIYPRRWQPKERIGGYIIKRNRFYIKNYEQQIKILYINKKFNTRGYSNINIDIHSKFSLKVTEVKEYNYYFNIIEISLFNIQ